MQACRALTGEAFVLRLCGVEFETISRCKWAPPID